METAKIPLSMPKPSPMFSTEPQLTALVDAAVNGRVGYSKSCPNIITSGSPGFDGKSGEPGAPGSPV